MKKTFVILTFLFSLVLIVLVGFVRSKIEASKHFECYKEKAMTLRTQFGKITFIDEGSGEPILSVHGICGGYDQGSETLSDNTKDFRIIAPSRFGYPGSELPENATVEMQVETFIELLDYLKIDKTFILATSAGGTSAIKFALMHPERTKGLILYSSGYPAVEASEKKLENAGPPSAFCNDFAMWMLSPLFPLIMGMPSKTVESIMPMKDRKKGILFDGKITNTVMINDYQDYDMSKIQVPVLMIHATDDKLANYDSVKQWISKIQKCTFLPLNSGGHLMSGNSNIINMELKSFIENNK